MASGSGYQPQLSPPTRRAKIWLAAICLLLPVVIIGASAIPIFASLAPRASAQNEVTWISVAAVAFSVLFCIGVFLVLRHFMLRRSLHLDRSSLTVISSFYRRQIALSDIDLAASKVINLDEKTEMKPLLKTNGFFIPGYQSGWFRTRSLKKTLVAILSGPKVLWLPTRLGYDVLLEVEHPDQFLRAMRDHANDASTSNSPGRAPQSPAVRRTR